MLFCLLILTIVLSLSETFTHSIFKKLSMQSHKNNNALNNQNWQEYLVEFRRLAPHFRWNEFNDAARSVGLGKTNKIDSVSVIRDPESSDVVCNYVRLPDDFYAKEICKRCSTVRRIIKVWGDGKDITTLCEDLKNRQAYYSDIFSKAKSWGVQFERHGRIGRSGMNYSEKRDLLSKIIPSLSSIYGEVKIKNPELELLYLEDWSTFQAERTALLLQHNTDTISASLENSNHNHHNNQISLKDFEKLYQPLRCLFGHIIAEGPSIFHDFALNTRPFVGTTSMNPVCAHLSANAALITPNQLVLDPFCGTGSLLIGAAYLGGNVVGTDIDKDGLIPPSKIIQEDMSSTTTKLPSRKNSNFRRKDGHTQQGKWVRDSFIHYNLLDRLKLLAQASVEDWLTHHTTINNNSGISTDSDNGSSSSSISEEGNHSIHESIRLKEFEQFDAIITDPPFGKRERTSGLSETANSHACLTDIPALLDCVPALGDSTAALVMLFQVAAQRLKPHGRLVFWLPTRSGTTAQEVEEFIEAVQHCAGLITSTDKNNNNINNNSSSNSRDDHLSTEVELYETSKHSLILQRVTSEILNDSLWRWLCVLQHQ